jgi:hypothetical protein
MLKRRSRSWKMRLRTYDDLKYGGGRVSARSWKIINWGFDLELELNMVIWRTEMSKCTVTILDVS